MTAAALQRPVAWAEDRATQRCDPSADPGAKTGAGAGTCPAPLPFPPLRDWHQSGKPSRQDAATFPAGCPTRVTNAKRPEFHFPLNQDTRCLSPLGSQHQPDAPGLVDLVRMATKE